VAACAGIAALATAAAAQNGEIAWPTTGRDLHGTRYLPATEINRDNVARLAVAWTYRTGETEPQFESEGEASFETTPIVVDGVKYVGTPLGRVIALDAENGHELWVFDPQIARDVSYGDFANRGVATWRDGAASDMPTCQRRVFIANAQSDLYALDARRGRPCTDFGSNGKVDLKQGLRIQPFERQAYSMTSPPIVGRHRIVGSSIADNTLPNPASGRGARVRRTAAACLGRGRDPARRERSRVRRVARDVAHDGGGANAWSARGRRRARSRVPCPRAAPRPTTTAACVRRQPLCELLWSRCVHRRASCSGRFKPCTTTSGTTTTRRLPRS
jgi:glucose dehydrogenase